jgi:serine/threonine-protein kinase RsbW
VITLIVPARFAYRDLVTRAIATACKVFTGAEGASRVDADDLSNAMISAVGEAFNNVVDHAYAGRGDGDVCIRIELLEGAMRVEMTDDGRSFDIDAVQKPDLAALPESGMGVFIIRSFVDDVAYEAGPPNKLVMTKQVGPNRRR